MYRGPGSESDLRPFAASIKGVKKRYLKNKCTDPCKNSTDSNIVPVQSQKHTCRFQTFSFREGALKTSQDPLG